MCDTDEKKYIVKDQARKPPRLAHLDIQVARRSPQHEPQVDFIGLVDWEHLTRTRKV